jgi:hypothetical protein
MKLKSVQPYPAALPKGSVPVSFTHVLTAYASCYRGDHRSGGHCSLNAPAVVGIRSPVPGVAAADPERARWRTDRELATGPAGERLGGRVSAVSGRDLHIGLITCLPCLHRGNFLVRCRRGRGRRSRLLRFRKGGLWSSDPKGWISAIIPTCPPAGPLYRELSFRRPRGEGSKRRLF